MKNRFDLLQNSEEILFADPIHFLPYSNDDIRLKLHVGDRRGQLVQSIKLNGVLEPVIVIPSNTRGKFEIVSGHNRANICLELGQEIPYRLRTDLTREQADLICIESNLLSRQHDEMLPSELARILKVRNDLMKSQGKRTDLTSDPVGLKFITVEKLSSDYKLSPSNVKRYIRLTSLIKPLLDMVDENEIAFGSGVELSFLKEGEQKELLEYIKSNKYKISLKVAEKLKKLSQNTTENIHIETELNGLSSVNKTSKTLKLNYTDLNKYIPKSDINNAKDIIIEALNMYYSNQ